MPPSTRRRIEGVVFAVGLLVALAAYARQWRYGDLPAGFPCADLAFPVQCGPYTAEDCRQLTFIVESWPPGAVIDVVEAGGQRRSFTAELREGPAALVLTGISGLVFLAAAAVFFLPRWGQPGVDSFFWITFLYGLGIMAGGVFLPRGGEALVGAVSIVQILCLAALPVVFLDLALTFPGPGVRWRGRLRPALPAAVAAALIAAGYVTAYLQATSAPTPAAFARLDAAHARSDTLMVVLAGAGVLLFALRSRRIELDQERRQVRWLLWGFAIGAAPYVFLRTLPGLLGADPLLPASFDRVVELAIPFAFVGAVVWHRFLDIDVIIRRSLLYGLLAAVLLLVYLAAGVVFGRWLASLRAVDPWVLPIVLGLGAGVAFMPLKRGLGAVIDRTFFKIAAGHGRRLEALDLALGSIADRHGLSDAVLGCVRETLAPRCAAVGMLREGQVLVEGDGDLAAARSWLASGGPAGALLASPRSTSRPERETGAFPPDLAAAGFVLVQAFDGRGPAPGAILVGSRNTGRRWIQEDLAFLQACARLAALHLERITLQQAVVAETLARERLAELDRMKTEFLAQVAHDLRTPAAGIAWSARNLLDGLAGDLAPAQVEYLQAIAGSGDHLNRLVDNLLEISRLDRAELVLDREPFMPGEVWAEAVRLVGAHAMAKGVAIAVHGAAGAPAVRGDRGKLLEVAVNILDNAVKYTAGSSAVDVTFAAAPGGALDMAVRDHGPGLGGQRLDALLGRFAQGSPSPHSTRKGFGLGLHIAVTYLEHMGGSLDAADHPDGGAVFTCRLPLAANTTEGSTT